MKPILLLLTVVFLCTDVSAQSGGQRLTYVNYTEFGGLFGRVASGPDAAQLVENRLSFTAQTFNGVQVSPRLAVGSLVGIDWYKTALVLPLGAGLRFDLARHPQRNVRLLALLDAGYGFTFLHQNSTGYELKGGWMINPGVALRLGKPAANAFVLALTYKRQPIDVQKPITGNDIERYEHRIYNRLGVRLGVSF